MQSNDINMNFINILQNVLDTIVPSFENNEVETEHQVILLKLFQCLEMLYNSINLTPEQATLVHNWLHNYCKTHKADGAEHTIIHKLLFTQRVRTQKGAVFEGIAKQIETLLGQIQDVSYQLEIQGLFCNYKINVTILIFRRSPSKTQTN